MKINNRMFYLTDKYNINLNLSSVLRSIFYILITYSITLKGAFFLGFTENKDPYTFNFLLGYSKANPFFNYYIAFICIFLSFGFLFKSRARYIYMLIINLIISLLFMIDLWYFRGFQTVPSVLLVTQTANLDNMSSSILSMTSKYDLVFLLDLLLLILYLVFAAKHFTESKRNFKTFSVVLFLSILYIGYIPFNVNILHREVKNSYIFSNYDPMDTARFFSPIGYHIFDIYNVYKDSKPYKVTTEDEKKITNFYSFKNENLPDNNFKGLFSGKNLLVLQVESLEDFVIDKKVDGQEITPSMNKLLKNSIYFPNTFEQVNEGTSSDSDLMVNTSMLPIRKGSTFFRYPNTTYASLPNLLEELNYDTVAIHADKGSFWNYAAGLKGIGFNKFIDYYSFEDDESIGLGLSDGTYLRQVVPKIKELKQPFYSFIVTLTSHGPFDLPDKYKELKLSNELQNNVLGDYFQAVHYTDKQIGILLNTLDKDGLLDNTVVVIVGDHTGVHKYYNDKINTLVNPESWYLDNGNHTVPFIIYQKNMKTSIKNDVIGGQVDIMPTIAYLMGIDSSKYVNYAIGRNLLNTNRSYAILTDKTIKGPISSSDEKNAILESLDVSDIIIKSNYFKNK